jgi:CRP-like cAMP-binding protein
MAADNSAEVTPVFEFHSKLNKTRQNFILTQLALADRERIVGRCERLGSMRGEVIYHPQASINHVYFPLAGLISSVLTGEGDESIEVGLVGNEAMVGLPYFLGSPKSPTRVIWQVAGESLRMTADEFSKEFDSNRFLRSLLERYAQVVIGQTAQSVFCNNFHDVDQRLCRWLLMAHDRLGVEELPLTQQFLAQMLGVRRPSVTVAVGMLESAGIITTRRGLIRIGDRARMEKGACACYNILRRQSQSLLLAP